MKPTLYHIEQTDRRAARISGRQGFCSLKTDYSFQASKGDFSGSGRGKPGPSFRAISQDYFRREARGHFAIEASVFGVIVLTAAIPVIQGIRGLAQFVYGIL